MAISVFDDKSVMPDDTMVAGVLVDSFGHWQAIQRHLRENYQNISQQWGFSKKGGWSKNIRNGKRSLFYFTPKQGVFQVYFFLSDRQVAAAKSSDIPQQVIARIPATKGCVCGFAFEMEIKTPQEANAIIKLIEIKDKN